MNRNVRYVCELEISNLSTYINIVNLNLKHEYINNL